MARDLMWEKTRRTIINIVDATQHRAQSVSHGPVGAGAADGHCAQLYGRGGEAMGSDDVARFPGDLYVPVISRLPSVREMGEMLRIAQEQMHVGVTVEPDDLYDDYTHQIHHRVGELIHDRVCVVGLPAHWTATKPHRGDRAGGKGLGPQRDHKIQTESVCREYEDAYALGDRETLIADSSTSSHKMWSGCSEKRV